MDIFDEETLRKLEALALIADKVRVGVLKGDRRSRKRGSSIEFADYRNYVQGDDLRHLDWHIFARLERPFVKLLEEEEDLAVHLLIDNSASMNWPEESQFNKFRYSLKLAGALGHIGLSSGDLVSVTTLGEEHTRWGPLRGQGNSLLLFGFLDKQAAAGRTALTQSLRDYAHRASRPGLLFLLSDLLSPEGVWAGVNALLARGYEIGLIHILSPDEIDPPFEGDLRIVDSETGNSEDLTLDSGTRRLYQTRLQEWLAETAVSCRQRGIHYIPVTTDIEWDVLIMKTMRTQGVLK